MPAECDCGEDVGSALAAIRSAIEAVLYTGPADVARRLADIARQHGVRLETRRPAIVLDLEPEFFASPDTIEKRCAAILS